MLTAFLFFKEPSPGAADRPSIILKVVVVQDPLVMKAVFLAKFVKFRGGAPPVIVITLQYDLSTGDLVDPGKILLGLYKSRKDYLL